MGKYEMKYGSGYISFSLPEDNIKGIIESNEGDSKVEEEVILDALNNPTGSPGLYEIVKPGEKVCIVISDITRSWQKMDKYLPYLVDELNRAGVKDRDITFLAATGSHRGQTEEEKGILLGEKLAGRFKVTDHDCKDEENLVYLGTTGYGTPVKVNKIAVESDHLILTGGIIFHDMAGWSGGRKSILPGIAGYESIMANHSLALKDEVGKGIRETVSGGNIKDNPLHEDMVEAAGFVKPSFIFNVIIDKRGKIASAVAGDYLEAHQAGRKIVSKYFGVDIRDRADLVIASSGGYPKDINLYQASKALVNASYAVKEGGYVILLAECREGIGHKEVEEIIMNFKTNSAREKYLRENFTISRYAGYLITSLIEKFNTILVSQMDEKMLKKTDITVVSSIESALEIVNQDLKAGSSIYLMPDAGSTMPVLRNRRKGY